MGPAASAEGQFDVDRHGAVRQPPRRRSAAMAVRCRLHVEERQAESAATDASAARRISPSPATANAPSEGSRTIAIGSPLPRCSRSADDSSVQRSNGSARRGPAAAASILRMRSVVSWIRWAPPSAALICSSASRSRCGSSCSCSNCRWPIKNISGLLISSDTPCTRSRNASVRGRSPKLSAWSSVASNCAGPYGSSSRCARVRWQMGANDSSRSRAATITTAHCGRNARSARMAPASSSGTSPEEVSTNTASGSKDASDAIAE